MKSYASNISPFPSLPCANFTHNVPQATWSENPSDDNVTSTDHTRFVSLFFVEVDAGLDAAGEIVDAYIPYTTDVLEYGTDFSIIKNEMVKHSIVFRSRLTLLSVLRMSDDFFK